MINVAGSSRAPLAEINLWINECGEFLAPHQIEMMIKRRSARKQQWMLYTVEDKTCFADGLLLFLEETTSKYLYEKRDDITDEREIMAFKLWMKRALLFMMKQYLFAQSDKTIKNYQ